MHFEIFRLWFPMANNFLKFWCLANNCYPTSLTFTHNYFFIFSWWRNPHRGAFFLKPDQCAPALSRPGLTRPCIRAARMRPCVRGRPVGAPLIKSRLKGAHDATKTIKRRQVMLIFAQKALNFLRTLNFLRKRLQKFLRKVNFLRKSAKTTQKISKSGEFLDKRRRKFLQDAFKNDVHSGN